MANVMSWAEWGKYDAVGLADLVRKGQVTPRELAEQVASGVAQVNPSISAVIELFGDVIENPVKDGMDPQGTFAGAPYLMKDIGPALKGRMQEMGAVLMKGNVSVRDSFLTQKIRQAGLNIMGRTTTSEFAVCCSAENPRVYVSHNPWDVSFTAGGSSSGSAAIVASGAIPFAHGSDGAGSIRGPAGINGVIGLKPSRGVFSAAPEASDLTAAVAVQGCLSRTVRDTAAFIDSCRGGAPGEFMPYWASAEPYFELIKRDPPKLKVALSHEWGDYRASAHIVDELERVGRFLEGLGHEVEWNTPDVDFRAAYAAQTAFYITHIATSLARLAKLRGHARPTVEFVEPMNVRIFEKGIGLPYSVRAQMQSTLNQISREFGQFFCDWDVVLTPVMALKTHEIGTLDFITLNTKDSPEEFFGNVWSLYPHLPPANLCGIPGISLPMAMHDGRLPLGIQALARQGNDGLLLQLAAEVERALDGNWNAGRRPGVHVMDL